MPNTPQLGGDLERAVMEVLWDLDESQDSSVRVVHKRLVERQLAYTTVMTVLERLGAKGLVSRTKVGRAFHYRPVATRAELTANLMRSALTGGREDRDKALVSFVDSADAEDLAALRRALSQLG